MQLSVPGQTRWGGRRTQRGHSASLYSRLRDPTSLFSVHSGGSLGVPDMSQPATPPQQVDKGSRALVLPLTCNSLLF